MRTILFLAFLATACGEVPNGDDTPDQCNTIWYADCDGDGVGVAGASAEKVYGCPEPAAPPKCGGSWTAEMPIAGEDDCDDMKADVHPGAVEICDMTDNDCDGQSDEDGLTTWFQDGDADGFGNPAMSMQACGKPAGYVTTSDDCNDTNSAVHPGAAEMCDGIDNNCNLLVDDNVQTTYFQDADGDGHGNAAAPMAGCNPAPGYVASSDDCNDNSAAIHPGAAEVCDSLDNNCNSVVDENVKTTYYRDADNDGHGNASVTTQACGPQSGYVSNSDDCNDSSAVIYPGRPEACDTLDNNCNNQVDEGVQTTFYRDADGDGYGNPAMTTMACSAPATYVSNNTDCNDGVSSVHPNATEVCFNGADDNCAGGQDEAPECSISCNWGGAHWLTHGWSGGNAFGTGAWAMCSGGKLAYLQFVNNVGTHTNPAASGTSDPIVGCNWGSANRWASQGWDGGNAFTFGMDTTCNGSRVTSVSWQNDQLAGGQIPPTSTAGQLGCNWAGAIYLDHGWKGSCAGFTGFNVTCNNGHITNFQWVENTAACARARD